MDGSGKRWGGPPDRRDRNGFTFKSVSGNIRDMFGLPLLQHFVTVSGSNASSPGVSVGAPVIGVILLFAALGILRLVIGRARRPRQRSRRPDRRSRGQRPSRPPPPPTDTDRRTVLVDGSNVIYWQDNTPQLAPLLQVVQDLSRRGLKPGVVFDANVGYKLTGKFLGECDLSRMLSLPRDQILVVPKGTQADPFLLETARDLKAPIVTNDRYRDWTDRYPDVAQPGQLITGTIRDGQVTLSGLEARDGAQ